MSKLQRLLNNVDLKELREIEQELSEGTIQAVLRDRLSNLERQTKTCPVCNRLIPQEEAFTLEFGPKDLRQKASFDAKDCLEYFIKHLNKQEDEYY